MCKKAILSGLHLRNFKAFANTQNIPLRNINILFGPNSGGKSSVIQSLLLAGHASKTGRWSMKSTGTERSLADLGNPKLYHNRNNLKGDRGAFEVGFELNLENLTWPNNQLLQHPVYKKGFEAFQANIHSNFTQDDTIKVILSNPAEYENWERGPFNWMEEGDDQEFSQENFKYYPESDVYSERAYKLEIQLNNERVLSFGQMDTWEGAYLKDIFVSHGDDPKLGLQDIAKGLDIKKLSGDVALVNSSLIPRELLLKPWKSFSPEEKSFCNELSFLMLILAEYLEDRLKEIQHVGPIRTLPRNMVFMEGAVGEEWLNFFDRDALSRINSFLSSKKYMSTPYKFTFRQFDWDQIMDWKKKGHIKLHGLFPSLEDSPHDVNILQIIDINKNVAVDTRNIGVGIEQVIPVLACLAGNTQRIIAIEQPELHLHPALQAELSDIIIESALRKIGNCPCGNQIIIETHSEHLILRIMKRIRDTFNGRLPEGLPEVKPENVSLLYVEPDKNNDEWETAGSVVHEIPLNEMGQLMKAVPGGFFEEGLREVLD